MTVDNIMKLDGDKPIPPAVEKAISRVLNIKVGKSTLPNNTIQLSSGGPQPLSSFTPITIALKGSDEASSRTVRGRTKQSKDLIHIISGESLTAMTTQATHIAKNMGAIARERI